MSKEIVLKCDLCGAIFRPEQLHTVSITVRPYNIELATKSIYCSDICGTCLTQALELNYSWMQLTIMHLRTIALKVRARVRRI